MNIGGVGSHDKHTTSNDSNSDCDGKRDSRKREPENERLKEIQLEFLEWHEVNPGANIDVFLGRFREELDRESLDQLSRKLRSLAAFDDLIMAMKEDDSRDEPVDHAFKPVRSKY